MRIVYHHRTLADGAEGIHIQEMVEAFESLGHSVQMDALAKPAARGAGHAGILATLRARLPQTLFEGAALGYNVVDYLRFRKLLRRIKPAFVYKRHALYDLGVILAAKAEGVPIVLEVNRPYSSARYHEFEPVRFPRAAATFEKRAFDAATLIAVVSTPLVSFVSRSGVERKKILLTPNGANPDRFKASPDAGTAVRRHHGLENVIVIGWVGILREWHGVDVLIQALSQLQGARLLIIGDGPDQPRLERLARDLGVDSAVVFTGRVPHAEMPNYIAAFDIAVASGDRTGYASPMKILEYMAMGKPVVAPRLPNIADLISDGEDGLLFESGNCPDLVATLRRLQADASLRHLLGDKARCKVARERNWRRNATDVLASLSRLASGIEAGDVTSGAEPSGRASHT